MTTVSGTFTTDGLSRVLRLRGSPETVTISVAGGYTGRISLEKSITTSELAWEPVLGPWTNGFTGSISVEPLTKLRLRATGFSGSSAYSFSDGDAVMAERRNNNNEPVMRLLESGDRIYRDLHVDGTLFIGGVEFISEPGSESAPGLLELATAAETLAGTDDDRAVHPLGLQSARTADLATSAADATTKANAAQAAAIAAAATDATTKANAAQAAAISAADTAADAGDAATLAAAQAYTDAEIAGIPGGVTPFLVEDSVASRTGSFTAVAGTSHRVDTSSGVSTPTMPSAPADKTRIEILDLKGTCGTNNITVTRGGSDTVMGATTFVMNVSYVGFVFSYNAATTDWRIV